MKKTIIAILLTFTALSVMSFSENPGKPATKFPAIAKTIVKPAVEHIGTKVCLTNDALLPVPVVTVYTNVYGAPGSTGTYACWGTYVVVTQQNECGQTEVIQQYWVSGSIQCGYIVNG